MSPEGVAQEWQSWLSGAPLRGDVVLDAGERDRLLAAARGWARRALLIYTSERVSWAEVAARLGVGLGTLHSAVHRALRHAGLSSVAGKPAIRARSVVAIRPRVELSLLIAEPSGAEAPGPPRGNLRQAVELLEWGGER